jgi:hypothetical protein
MSNIDKSSDSKVSDVPYGGFPPIFLCDKTRKTITKEKRELAQEKTKFLSIRDMFSNKKI